MTWLVCAFSWDGRIVMSAKLHDSDEAAKLAERWFSLGAVARVAVTQETRKPRGMVS